MCVFECLPELFLVALVEDIGAFVDVVDFEVEGKVLVNFVKVSLQSSISRASITLLVLGDIVDAKNLFFDEAAIVEIG